MASSSEADGDDYFLAAEMRGRRSEMEDAHVVACGPRESFEPCLFGVFDGHGGDECARFLSQNLCSQLASHALFFEDPHRVLVETFLRLDEQYIQLAKQLELEDGSTATVLLCSVKDQHSPMQYLLACVGDSRAIIIKQDGSAKALVEDHNPTREDERIRIREEGGEVLYDVDNEIYRVASEKGGGLAVTRAFGDFNFKPYVTARPEIFRAQLAEDDAYICLASDGLWGDLSNEEVGRAIIDRGAKKGVEYVMEEAFARGSDDNITVVVVDLQTAQKRLQVEAATRRPPSGRLSRQSSSNNRRQSPARMLSSSADDGAGPVPVDPLLVQVARKLSSVAPPSLKLTTDVDDVEIPGIPAVFSNDLVLWRDPVVSFLWFFIINTIFAVAVFLDIPMVTLISLIALSRMLLTFISARVLFILKRVGVLKDSFDIPQFIMRNHVISGATVTYFSDATRGTLIPINKTWNDIIIRGSTTKVLVALRTLTYLYTPIPVIVLVWVAFILVFTVPATYARKKTQIDEFWKNSTNKIQDLVKPHVNALKAQVNKVYSIDRTNTAARAPRGDGDVSAGPVVASSYRDLVKQGIVGNELSEEL